MKEYEKKGQMTGPIGAVVMLITGVGVGVLVLIFVGSLGGQTYELVEDDILDIGNNVITADTFTAVNGTAVALDHHTIQTGTISIYNVSNGYEFGLGNFTIDYGNGTVQLLGSSGAYNGSSMAANYTWGEAEIRSHVQNGILSGFDALEQTGNYLPIIVLAVVIALVLSLVLGFTALSGRGGSGSAL